MRRTVICLSGAGLSQESGIPTFRDSGGLWEGHNVTDVASQDGWQRDKLLVLDFYAERLKGLSHARPNAAHLALARLQEKFNLVNITQNIDPLLEQAGCINVWHLHGEILKKKCEKHKEITVLDGDINFTCDYKTNIEQVNGEYIPVALGDLCPKCGGQMRPDVVWFGEAVNAEETVVKLDDDFLSVSLSNLCKEVKYNDGVFIVVGTSAQVYPAASMIPFFGQIKHKYIVDKKPVKISDFVLLEGLASEQLDQLVSDLLA